MLPTYYCYNYQAPVSLLVSHVRPSLFLTNSCLFSVALRLSAGYGFVDFDSPAAAQKAVSSLKATGVQAQMAKVRELFKQMSSPLLPFALSVALYRTLNCPQWFNVMLSTGLNGSESSHVQTCLIINVLLLIVIFRTAVLLNDTFLVRDMP